MFLTSPFLNCILVIFKKLSIAGITNAKTWRADALNEAKFYISTANKIGQSFTWFELDFQLFPAFFSTNMERMNKKSWKGFTSKWWWLSHGPGKGATTFSLMIIIRRTLSGKTLTKWYSSEQLSVKQHSAKWHSTEWHSVEQ